MPESATKLPNLTQLLSQGLLGGIQGLQRLRSAGQLERELRMQYARLGQLYTDEHPHEELQAVRGHILELRALQSANAAPPAAQVLDTQVPAAPKLPAPAHLPVTGMAARIWQAKEEERDEAEGEYKAESAE